MLAYFSAPFGSFRSDHGGNAEPIPVLFCCMQKTKNKTQIKNFKTRQIFCRFSLILASKQGVASACRVLRLEDVWMDIISPSVSVGAWNRPPPSAPPPLSTPSPPSAPPPPPAALLLCSYVTGGWLDNGGCWRQRCSCSAVSAPRCPLTSTSARCGRKSSATNFFHHFLKKFFTL